MATFREASEALLFAYQDGSIDDTEFALLYDLNSSENLEFPYWKYGRFDLDSMTDDECKTEFRFFMSLKISLETLERSFHSGERTDISREASKDI